MIETLSSNRPTPCKGCPDRYPACSGHCKKPDFLAYQAELEKIRKARKAYYSPIWAHDETDTANFRKHKRRK